MKTSDEIIDAADASRMIAKNLGLTDYEGVLCLSGAKGAPPACFNDSPRMYREGELRRWIRNNKSKLMRE